MNGLGLLLMDRGYYDEARAVLSRAVQTDPRGSMPLANRGVLNSLVEELGKARADFEGSLAIDPGNYAALNGRGWVSLKEGKTDEAVKSFLEASLLEPRHSQSRTFLAIAYYQQGHIERALEELALAESLDPKDPFPHLVAYVIHQDTYRIGDAVREAGRVLELIPNFKSVDEIASTRTGLSNLGSALSTLGLSSFAESYAQESFDPHVASSHFFASQQYNTNSSVTISELTQGLLLDPLAVSSPTRYQDIVRRPRTAVSLSATLGRVQGDDTRSSARPPRGTTGSCSGSPPGPCRRRGTTTKATSPTGIRNRTASSGPTARSRTKKPGSPSLGTPRRTAAATSGRRRTPTRTTGSSRPTGARKPATTTSSARRTSSWRGSREEGPSMT
jgi:lipoprotein NlpI